MRNLFKNNNFKISAWFSIESNENWWHVWKSAWLDEKHLELFYHPSSQELYREKFGLFNNT